MRRAGPVLWAQLSAQNARSKMPRRRGPPTRQACLLRVALIREVGRTNNLTHPTDLPVPVGVQRSERVSGRDGLTDRAAVAQSIGVQNARSHAAREPTVGPASDRNLATSAPRRGGCIRSRRAALREPTARNPRSGGHACPHAEPCGGRARPAARGPGLGAARRRAAPPPRPPRRAGRARRARARAAAARGGRPCRGERSATLHFLPWRTVRRLGGDSHKAHAKDAWESSTGRGVSD